MTEVIPYPQAVAEAARRLNRALGDMRQLELSGGATAVARQSCGVKNGMSVAQAEAAFLALPREAPSERRAA